MTIYVQHLGRSSLLLGVSLPCLLLCSPNPDRAVQHSDSRDGLLEVVLDESDPSQVSHIPSLSSLDHSLTVRSFPPLTIHAASLVTSVLKTGPE